MRTAPENNTHEILKRREQGRLIRSLLIPVSLGLLSIIIGLHLHLLIAVIISLIISMALILLLYAYAEYCVFAECSLLIKAASDGRWQDRQELYADLQALISEINYEFKVTIEHFSKLHKIKKRALFLFDSSVTDEIDMIIKNAGQLRSTSKQLNGTKELLKDKRDNLQKMNNQSENYFVNLENRLENIFKPFREIKNT